MGKKHKTTADTGDAPEPRLPTRNAAGLPFVAGGDAIDPSLASLFNQSSGPVLAPQFTARNKSASFGRREGNAAGNKEDKDSTVLGDHDDESADDDEQMFDGGDEERSAVRATEDSTSEEEVADQIPSRGESKRKRKRADRNDDLEESYMRRVAREEAREHKKHKKDTKEKGKPDGESLKQRKVKGSGLAAAEQPEVDSEASSSSPAPQAQSDQSSDDEEEDTEDINNTAPPVPLHEAVAADTKVDESSAIEESSRTVFLGNVSTDAIKSKSAKKTLLSHLGSFFPSLSFSAGGNDTTPRIESIRFRSTAFSTSAVPKRGAYARRDLMDSTTRSTNAYVVYSTAAAARKALSLNGSVVLDRHLRVDSVAHPAKVDHRRCVFVGNLSFVDEETSTEEPEDKTKREKQKKKKKQQQQPADAEEGLWRTFNSHTKHTTTTTTQDKTTTTGPVESVRVVRDRSTRVGKGFAYVQFHDENPVEAALLLGGKKFPPLLPRTLRVVRAKRSTAAAAAAAASGRAVKGTGAAGSHEQASLAGRAARMLGQAGAAKLREKAKREGKGVAATGANAIATTTATRGAGAGSGSGSGNTHIVFEGHRASEVKGPRGPAGFKVKTKSRGAKARGSGSGGGGKPKTRSARRGKAWKNEKKGGKK